MKNCKQCGDPIGHDKRRDSVFCSSSCKAKYHELSGEDQEYTGALGNIKPKTAPRSEQFDKPLEKISEAKKPEALEPFKNLLNAPTPQPQAPKVNTAQLLPVPPPQITKQVSVPNPKHEAVSKEFAELKECIQKNLDTIKKLNEQIQLENDKNGSDTYVTTGITGAVVGYLTIDGSNQHKKDGNSFWGTAACSLLGLMFGNMIESDARPIREKQKAENIKQYKERIKLIEDYIKTLRPREAAYASELAKHAPLIFEMQSVYNPGYLAAIMHNARIEKENSSEDTVILNFEGLQGIEKQKPNSKNSLETDKILSARNMVSQQIPLLNFKEKWLDFIGQPQTNFFLVVHGMSGEGKTHFTIQFAKYLADFGNVLYVSGEEGFAPTMQKKLKDMGAMVPALYVGDFRTGGELLNEVPNKYHFIVIDSTNNMDINPDLMKAIRQRFKESGIIAVCQSTKDDKIRGSYQIVHDSDITVKVNNGIAVTTKNRFKQKGTEFDIFAFYKKSGPKVILMKPDDKLDEVFRNTL